MDADDFQKLLVSLNSSDNESRTNAEKVLSEFMESNYLSYLELLVFFMSKSDSQFIKKQCVTYLFITARRDPPFLSIEVLDFLWPKLKENYVNILLSPVFPSEAKNLFCSIVALCASFYYKTTESIEIQKFLLQSLEEKPQLVKYVAFSLNELFIAAGSTCEIAISDIMMIVTSDLSSLANIGLFFAMASIDPQEEILHEAFNQIMESVDVDSISEFLKIIMNFTEKSATFLDPHLEDFTNYLCAIALNKDFNNERMYAMMCMASIARGAPKMCQMSKSRFIFPVTHCLISIIAEITDDSNWNYDPNDTQPFVIAKDTFGIVSKECGNATFFEYFINLMSEALSDSKQPWQVTYSFIAAFNELDAITLSPLIDTSDQQGENESPVVPITKQIMPFIEDLECHPRIRQAGYQTITRLCNWIGPYYQRKAGHLVLPPLKDLIFKETHPITRKSVIVCLANFFSQLTAVDVNKYFDQTFNELIHMFKTAPTELKPHIAKCLGFILKAGGSQFFNYYPVMAEAMLELLHEPSVPLQICAIEAFAISYYPFRKVPPECVEPCKTFLSAVISILKSEKKNDLSQKMIESCNHSICILIKGLGINFIQFADDVLPTAIENAGASIEVTTVGAMDFTNERFSFQISIPTVGVSGVKQFVNKSDVQSICKSLEIIDSAEKAMMNEFQPYLDASVKVASQWLTSQYHIEPIMISSCNILRNAIRISYANGCFTTENLELITELYLQNITPLSSQKLIESLLLVIQDAFFLPCNQDLSEEIKIKVLETIPEIIEITLDRKMKIINDKQQWQTLENSNKEIDKQDYILNTKICDFAKLCFERIPDLMVPFFQENMMGKFTEYIERPESQTLALQVWSEYLITSEDTENLSEFLPALYSFASMENLDLSPIAFEIIGTLFCTIKFDPEMVEECYIFIRKEMKKQYIEELNDSSLIADFALISLTKIIKAYPNVLKRPDVLSFWFERLPIWDASNICDVVYSFLADLLEEKNAAILYLDQNREVLNEYNFEKIIEYVSENAYSSFMEETTSKRFAVLFQNMYENPQYKELMDSASLNLKNDKIKNVFNRLLSENLE